MSATEPVFQYPDLDEIDLSLRQHEVLEVVRSDDAKYGRMMGGPSTASPSSLTRMIVRKLVEFGLVEWSEVADGTYLAWITPMGREYLHQANGEGYPGKYSNGRASS